MHFRLFDPADVAPCLGRWPLSGVAPSRASEVLTRVVTERRATGAVIERALSHAPDGFGLAAFVRGETVERDIEGNARGFVAALVEREAAGERVLLDEAGIAGAQSRADLHAVVLAYRQRSYDPDLPLTIELLGLGHAAFRMSLEGYHLESVWQEASAEDYAFLLQGGHLVKRRYSVDAGNPVALMGVRRGDVSSPWPSHTVSFLFHRRPARLHLTSAQRRVAWLALWQLRDDQIARRLGITNEAVRRHWRGILDRAALTDPDAFGNSRNADNVGGRGPERRRHLLDYIRQNLQEIRPVATSRVRP